MKSVRELGAALRSRRMSCVELMAETLADIKRRDTFRSIITLTDEQALAEARERDRELATGVDRGPFHGIPIAHKDLFCTRGVRTTGGSLVFRDFVPQRDATVVKRFREAGAISVGKTNLHELAYGITSKNPHYGFVLNPRNPAHIAGGSSGGSATLVAGDFLPVALGTDTGGSIRIPASFCGIAGIKPTYGRVSRYGVLPLAYSLDHVGPLGSCVEDCALALNVIAGHDSNDPTSAAVAVPDFDGPALETLRGLRVGVPKNFYFERVDAEVEAAARNSVAVMERDGAAVEEVTVPDIEQANAASRVIQYSETVSVYAGHTDSRLFGADTWNLLEQGRMIAGHEYVTAQRLRSVFRREMDALWERIDVLVAPTTPIAAPGLEETSVRIGDSTEDARMASTRLVRAINFFGEPAVSMPCGNTSAGLPIGLQLIAAPFREAHLLQIARTLENALR